MDSSLAYALHTVLLRPLEMAGLPFFFAGAGSQFFMGSSRVSHPTCGALQILNARSLTPEISSPSIFVCWNLTPFHGEPIHPLVTKSLSVRTEFAAMWLLYDRSRPHWELAMLLSELVERPLR